MPPKEPTVHPKSPMPPSYGFLPKGNPYLTSNLRRLTHAAAATLYVVKHKSTTLGLRAPQPILDQVLASESATREKRAVCVRRRDAAAARDLEAAVRAGFPRIPGEDLRAVVGRALVKRSGRVGRTGLLGVDQKARLAVAAHVRHRHTDYGRLVRGPMKRHEARKAIREDMERVLGEWRRGTGETKPEAMPRRQRQSATSIPSRPRRPTASSIPSRPRQPTANSIPSKAPGATCAARASARLQGNGGALLAVLDVFDDDDDDDDGAVDSFIDDFEDSEEDSSGLDSSCSE